MKHDLMFMLTKRVGADGVILTRGLAGVNCGFKEGGLQKRTRNLLTGSITAKSIAHAQCEDEVCLFDDSTTSTTSKKPRLFKDGIL